MMDYEKIEWKKDRQAFLEYLNSLSDEKYREFSKKTTPGEFKIIGVNLPTLKKIAKNISKTDYEEFLSLDDEEIFEFKMLKSYVISNIEDISEYKKHFTYFIRSIDNWSLCDSFLSNSKIISKDRDYFFNIAKNLLKTKDEFENRIAFVILLEYFVTSDYIEKIFDLIADYKSDKYYANMALAWLLCELYIKFTERTKTFLLENRFDREVTKYTVRKIKDSYRVREEDKKWLKKID